MNVAQEKQVSDIIGQQRGAHRIAPGAFGCLGHDVRHEAEVPIFRPRDQIADQQLVAAAVLASTGRQCPEHSSGEF
jgi:hypothetical protein